MSDVNDVTVLFGRRGRGAVTKAELRRPGRRGVKISVAFAGNISVLAAGDATGDGLADVAVVYGDLTTDTGYEGPAFVVAGGVAGRTCRSPIDRSTAVPCGSAAATGSA